MAFRSYLCFPYVDCTNPSGNSWTIEVLATEELFCSPYPFQMPASFLRSTNKDDTELGLTILSCISDNENYLVKNPKLKKLIFSLVKEKLRNESLVLTPNMIRFLALKMINEDQSLIVKIGNMVVSSNNRVRLFTRITGTTIIAFVGAVFSILPYAILMAIMYFNETKNCGYNCDAYFQHLPKDEPLTIYGKASSGNIAITNNDESRQVEIYVKQNEKQVVISKSGERRIEQKYQKSRKKAKQIKFSDFKKRDPVLSKFNDLGEPDIPQKSCGISDVHDLIDIRID